MTKNAIILFVIVVVVVGAILGLGIYLKSLSPVVKNPDANIVGDKVLVRPNSYMTGSPTAKVTLVEFGDFQCPFCGQAYPVVKAVTDKYGANPNFNFVFRNFPLPQHPNAPEAAEAAEAAGAQGKFFQMYDLLYQHQNDWSGSLSPTDFFLSYAGQLELDVNKFQSDVLSSNYINQITQDQKDGEALGVDATPTFFLNGTKLPDYTNLDSQIAQLLANH
jgi:protein-disulfide isomerase